MTRVVNIYREDYDVYIGRPGKGQSGKWGNPFSKGTREENVAAFREWILTQPHLLLDLHELKGKRLGCFCAPKACHGDVLAELAEAVYPEMEYDDIIRDKTPHGYM
jgi:hypothetical protein